MRHLQDQTVLILGLGASGLAMARWCLRHGAIVRVADTRAEPPLLATLREELPAVEFTGGAFSPALVEGSSVRAVYRSPGLSPAVIAPVADAARAMGLPVGGELDLFARALADLALPPEAVDAATAEPDVQGDLLAEAPPALVIDAPPVPAQAEQISAAAEASVALPEPQAAAEVAAAEESSAQPLPVAQPGDTQEQPELQALEEPEEVDQALEAPEAVDPVEQTLVEDGDDEVRTPIVLEIPLPEVVPGYHPTVLAITGTNGKTTVTALTGQLMQRAGKSVAVAGNIGPTLLDTLSAHMDADTLPEVWVLELSSFQLDGVTGFEPTAAVVLNVTQDHLDWHGDMASYAAAKARVFGQKALMLLNRDDPAVMAMLPPPLRVRMKAPLFRAHQTFGAGAPERPGDYGIETVNGMAWLARANEADETLKRRKDQEVELFIQRLMPVEALRIRGRHNATNALAALALAVAAGCPLGRMLHGLREYQGEPHRVESIAVIGDVEYFDDSKGTNVGATAAALSGLGAERRLVVILGGEGKGQDFSPLAEPISRYARAVVLIGRDAALIRQAVADSGVDLHDAASMEQAVTLAARLAQTGDAVLMSPACASFDMFDNYEHRARVFVEAVQALAQDAGGVV